MAYVVTAVIVMAYIVMTYAVMAYIIMAYAVVAYAVVASTRPAGIKKEEYMVGLSKNKQTKKQMTHGAANLQ